MPGLLDLLSQGGQFVSGLQARKKDDALAEEKRKQEAALQQALLEYHSAQSGEARARAYAIQHPTPDLITDINGLRVPDVAGVQPFRAPDLITGADNTRIEDAPGVKVAPPYHPLDLITDNTNHRVADRPGVEVAPPSAGAGGSGGFGAGGIGGAGRQLSAIESLGVAHKNMKNYEQQVLSGTATFDGIDQFKSRIAGHFDKSGLVDDAVLSAALADMGANNPALATYLQNEYLWALEDGVMSNRPSDFRTKLDTFVSAMKANPTPETMASIWQGRESRLHGYEQAVPAIQARLRAISGNEGVGADVPPPAESGAFDLAEWLKQQYEGTK